jgi:uncharacterized coiled-coil DUF342 family protein
MAKKKKNTLNQILGIAGDLTDGINKIVPDAMQIYDISKDMASTSSKAMAVNERKNKIKELLVEIGDRFYDKHIEVDDRNVKAEVECIEELLKEMK